jgi:probable F420-dependent oxidoreductase
VVLEQDPGRARATARGFVGMFLSMPHYARSVLRQGFSEEELAGGGSDRLIDSLVAWGDVETIGRRIRAHHEAGVDHVCLHVLGADGMPLPQWRRLAELTRDTPEV